MDGPLTVNGNLELDSGGQLLVGRNLDDLTVNGNVIVNPSGSGIVVNGVLGDMVVDGTLPGTGRNGRADVLRPGRRAHVSMA